MKKKIFCLIFIFYMLISSFIKVFSIEKAEVNILSNKDYLKLGEEIEITIFIKNAKLIAYNFELFFDSEKLELVSKEENTNIKENKILTYWYDIEGGKRAKINEIEKYVFRAKEEGIVEFEIEGEFYGSTGELLDIDYKTKEIEINSLENKKIENILLENLNTTLNITKTEGENELNQNIDNVENIINSVKEENSVEENEAIEDNKNKEIVLSNINQIENNIVQNDDLKNKNIVINEVNQNESNISKNEVENNIAKDNANLKTLRINREGLVPEFKPEVYKYYLSVPKEIENLDIVAEAENPNAVVKISGNNQLEEGLNNIKIEVMSEDNSKINIYELQITKTSDLESANTNLQTLAIENAMLNPSFDNNIIKYNVEISNSIKDLRILAVPEDENARVEITGGTNLKEGKNEIKIVVIAKNKFTKKEILIEVYKRNKKEEENFESEQKHNAEKIEEAYTIGNSYKITQTSEAEGKIDNINKQDSKNLLYIAIVIFMFILSGVLGIVFYKIYLKK